MARIPSLPMRTQLHRAGKTVSAVHADVVIENNGSVVLVRPLSDRAFAWIQENVHVEQWQWFGRAVSVEPRYVADLVAGMQADGLVVA